MIKKFNASNISKQENNSIISLIITPIIVKAHNHPLLFCYPEERNDKGNGWRIDNCSLSF